MSYAGFLCLQSRKVRFRPNSAGKGKLFNKGLLKELLQVQLFYQPRVNDVSKGILIEGFKKSIRRFEENMFQLAGRGNDAGAVFRHAVDNGQWFELADDFADVDFVGRFVQADAAFVAADAFQVLLAGEAGDNFRQVAPGNAIGLGDLGNVDEPVRVCRRIHQYA